MTQIALTGFNIALIVLALITLIGALRVIGTRSVIHAAFWLFPVFAGIAGFYLLLGAQFLAAIQVLIYIGAILVLIIFAVTLTRNAMQTDEATTNTFGFPVFLAALVLIVAVVGAALRTELPQPVMALTSRQVPNDFGGTTTQYTPSQTELRKLEDVYLVPTHLATRTDPETPGLPVSEVPALGVVLLQQYLLPFEIASILLLAGMIGAIVLARKERKDGETAATDADNKTSDAPARESVEV